MFTVHWQGRHARLPPLKENQSVKQYLTKLSSQQHLGGELDFQKLLGKFPGLPWAKYKGEKHLPGHNFTGAQTNLDKRLDQNNNVIDNNYPINRIDQAAMKHDIFYRDNEDLNARHTADKIMIQELNAIENPTLRENFERMIVKKALQAKVKLGIGLPPRKSKQKAVEFLREVTSDLKRSSDKEVEKLTEISKPKPITKSEPKPFANVDVKTKFELDKMTKLADELHKPFRKPKELRKIKFRSKDNIWNADLVIMPKEDDFKYILTVLDGYTKYAWCVPLKDKSGETVANAFKEIMRKSNRKPNKLFVDEGKEFYNQHMYKLFKFKKEDILEKDENGEYKNKIYSVFNFGKNPIIERFNRTLTNKLWKQFTINGNQKWLHILQPTVDKYNNSFHRTINTTPKLASKDPSLVKMDTEPNAKRTKPRFKVNDRVRIFKWKDKFEKGYKGYWSKEIFKIKEVKNTSPITYKIEDLDNEEIHGSFYNNELQRSWF